MEGAKPIALPLRSTGPAQAELQRRFVDKYLKLGFIRDSKSSFASQLFFVPKKDKAIKERPVVDYRLLNDATIKEKYLIPGIDALQQRLKGAKFFTKMDAWMGFFGVRIKEGDEYKSAFRTMYGLFEWLVMPMGMTNAPGRYQRIMNKALAELIDKCCIVYLDDVLVYSKTMEQHRKDVRAVLALLRKEELHLNLAKCEFDQDQVVFCGHMVTAEGIRMDPEKAKAIKEWQPPNNIKEIQSFLGTTNYIRRFIKGYSGITAPISELTKKDVPFLWIRRQEDAFKKLKELMANSPCLEFFDWELETRAETDASDYAVGGVLTQKHGEKDWRVVAYFSKKFSSAEMHYTVPDKELLAIVLCFKAWNEWLIGPKYQVEVLSDHINLTTFTIIKNLGRR